jgi:hypothetical protein
MTLILPHGTAFAAWNPSNHVGGGQAARNGHVVRDPPRGRGVRAERSALARQPKPEDPGARAAARDDSRCVDLLPLGLACARAEVAERKPRLRRSCGVGVSGKNDCPLVTVVEVGPITRAAYRGTIPEVNKLL